MKTTFCSLAMAETAGPSADVRVPTRKSTFSFRMSSRATRTASLASALESRTSSSTLRPSTPPLALSSSTNICAPFDAGSPKRAGGPESGIGMPTLIGFCASAARGSVRSVARSSMTTCSMTEPPIAGRFVRAMVALRAPAALEREAEPVRPIEVVHEQRRRSRICPRAEDALKTQLLRAGDTEELRAAVGRIAEVDGAVRRAHDVVGAIQLLAVPVRGDRLRGSVGEGHRHLARGVLAGEQAPPTVPGEPVRFRARLSKRRDAVGRRPPAQMITGHVAPEQEAPARMPERSFGEEAAAGDLLEGHSRTHDCAQAGIANFQAPQAVRSMDSSPSRNSDPEARSVAREARGAPGGAHSDRHDSGFITTERSRPCPPAGQSAGEEGNFEESVTTKRDGG